MATRPWGRQVRLSRDLLYAPRHKRLDPRRPLGVFFPNGPQWKVHSLRLLSRWRLGGREQWAWEIIEREGHAPWKHYTNEYGFAPWPQVLVRNLETP